MKTKTHGPLCIAGLAVVLFLTSSAGFAQVMEVNIWNPMPGKGPQTMGYAQEARAIHEKHGGSVGIGQSIDGRLHYALSFENWTAWAKFGTALQKSKDWQGFLAKINDSPSATLEENLLLNTAAASDGGGPVYQVFVWEPVLGRGSDLIQAAMTAKKIHEKNSDAKVAVLVDQLNRMHYAMSFDSWEAWGKFNDTPDPEFQKFMNDQNADPTARLVRVHTASRP